MPIIPRVERQRMLPSAPTAPLVNTEVAGAEMGAIAGLSKDLTTILIERQKEMQRHDDALSLLRLENEADDSERKFKEAYNVGAKKASTLDDLKRFSESEAKTFDDALRAGTFKNIPDHLAPRAERIIGARRGKMLDYMAVFQAGARKEITAGEINRALETATLAARDGDAMQTGLFAGKIDDAMQADLFAGKIMKLHQAGALTAAQAEEHIVKGQRLLAESYIDGLVTRDPIAAANFIKTGRLNEYLTPEKFRHYQDKAETLGRQEQERQAQEGVSTLLQERHTGADGVIDTTAALRELLNQKNFTDIPGLTIQGRQNVAQTIREIDAAQEKQKTRRQTETMKALYEMAVTSPSRALAEAGKYTDRDVDPKELLTFKKSMEMHLSNIKLLSRQEAEYVKKIQNEAQTRIMLNIRDGVYKSEMEVRGAVQSLALDDPRKAMEDAIKTYEGVQKAAGRVDWYKEAVKDWTRHANSATAKADKKRLHEKLPEIQKSLSDFMVNNKIAPTDEALHQEYKKIKAGLTMTPWDRKIKGIKSSFDDYPEILRQMPGGEILNEMPEPAARRSEALGRPVVEKGAVIRDRITGRQKQWDGTEWVDVK